MIRMTTTALVAALSAALSAPAHAGQWDEEIAMCVDAIAVELGEDPANANADLKALRDRATKRLTLEVDFASGREAVGVCEIRRGEFSSVEIKES